MTLHFFIQFSVKIYGIQEYIFRKVPTLVLAKPNQTNVITLRIQQCGENLIETVSRQKLKS